MKINKYLLKATPYLTSILVGLILYFIGLNLSENIRGLFTSLSAAFFAIPLIYLFYQVAQNLSKKRLNKEIFDYAKMQVDREVLSIINQLNKIVYPLKEKDFSAEAINIFLSFEKDKLKEVLSNNEYLGFQVFKKWEVSEENLNDVLKNSYILARLSDEQIISIILIIKKLRHLEMIQKSEDLYIETGKKATSYKIVAGKELNEANIKFPDRYLLLQDLEDGKSLVADFGDFYLYNVDKLLYYFKINESYLEDYTESIFQLIIEINNWVDLTGGEFVIDTKMFRSKPKFYYINLHKKVRTY
jgi:dsDNA-binding SOS-regulon protein